MKISNIEFFKNDKGKWERLRRCVGQYGVPWFVVGAFSWITLITACQEDGKQESPVEIDAAVTESFSDRLTEVDTLIVKAGTFFREVVSQGKVVSRNKIQVPFTAQGLITEVTVREGQHVQKGDLLLSLDNFMLMNQMEKLEAQIRQTRLDMENHYINLGYSPHRMEEISQKVKTNVALQFNLESLLIDRKRLEHELSSSKITAPFSGTVAELEVREGAHTSAYDKVCTLVDNRNLSIHFPVLESEVTQIKIGMEVEVRPFFQSPEMLSGAGRITHISPLVNTQGMIECSATIGKSNIPYRDGMRVNVYIRDAIPGVLTLPKSAVVDRQNRLVVFTLTPDLRAYWNYVEIGGENSDSYLIREGLEMGDTVIVNNNFDLAHLEKVAVR